LLTLRGPGGYRCGAALHDLGLIEDGAVLIRDGVVDAVGPSRRLENLSDARGALEIPAHGRVVMPGFVDQGLSLFVPEVKRRTYLQVRSDAATMLRACLQHGTTSAEIDAGGNSSCQYDLPWIRQAIRVPQNGDTVVGWRLILNSGLNTQSDKESLVNQLKLVARRPEVRNITLELEAGQDTDAVLEVIEEATRYGFRVKLAGEPDTAERILRDSRRLGCVSFTGHSAPAADRLDVLAELGYPAVLRPQVDVVTAGGPRVDLQRFLASSGIPVLATG